MTTTFEVRRAAGLPVTLEDVAIPRVSAVGARYLSRPGRHVVVAACLEDLQGPAHGTVELPLWLFWHPDRTFDLDKPGILAWMYQVVLREASSAADLAYLNGDLLTALWPDLHLPRGVRRAWEDQHPVLRSAVPAQS
jgi:hypothetical protein